MKKIGVLFGMENTFPGALVKQINSRNLDGISAEFVEIGAIRLDRPPAWSVIVDRISHDIPFYRAFLKHAVLHGTTVINNPFWWSADDKFFNYSLAAKLGVAAPPTVILPHKHYPPGTTDRSMRNLEFRSTGTLSLTTLASPPFSSRSTAAAGATCITSTPASSSLRPTTRAATCA